MTGFETVAGQTLSGNQQAAERWSHALMNNFGVPPVELVSGRGAVVTDADGKQYLDLLGGIAVNALGHAHPAIVDAVSRQVATLGHVSNFFTHPTVLALAPPRRCWPWRSDCWTSPGPATAARPRRGG